VTSKATQRDMLDLIIAKANDLRKAGVLTVQLGDGCSFQLAAFEPEPTKAPAEEPPDGDPLNDPVTYGLPRDGQAPHYDHEPQE
jgi:hypothetical protein